MKERPILFSGPMVRAILEGRKTQTRRVVKGTALDWLTEFTAEYVASLTAEYVASPENHLCPYGVPGDRLWVRETFYECVDNNDSPRYAADGAPPTTERRHCKKRPSIFMPRWASRINLEITGVRVERLKDISHEDAIAEGVDLCNASINGYPQERYRRLWESINGPGSWEANPWVWVVEFKKGDSNV